MHYTIEAEKQVLRSQMLKARRTFVSELPQSVRNLVFIQPPPPARKLLQSSKCAAFYMATAYEAPTARYLDFAVAQDTKIALPRFGDKTADMEFREYAGKDELKPGPFGMMQPVASSKIARPDLLVLPMLAFDDALQRLGQGGGHYDRYLAHNPGIRTIGLAWSVQQVELVPTASHDAALDMVITQSSFFISKAKADKEID